MYPDSPRISVLMSVYNAEAFVANAIQSILNQSFRDFEFIIINDGSNDASVSIIQSFQDSRIHLVDNGDNKGLIASLNIGLALAKGKYIARMDADDEALPDRLKRQVELMEQHPDVCVTASDYYLWKDGHLTLQHSPDNSGYLKAILLFSTCFAHPTVMIRNNRASKAWAYHPDFIHAEDYKLWTDLAFLGEFRNVTSPLLKYREHGAQISAQNKTRQEELSARIRKAYFKQWGFEVSASQFTTHSIIANNKKITSVSTLRDIEAWLMELTRQNDALAAIEPLGFKTAMRKFWYDSCGYSNLGLRAYRLYHYSELSRMGLSPAPSSMRLLVKCLIRKFTWKQEGT